MSGPRRQKGPVSPVAQPEGDAFVARQAVALPSWTPECPTSRRTVSAEELAMYSREIASWPQQKVEGFLRMCRGFIRIGLPYDSNLPFIISLELRLQELGMDPRAVEAWPLDTLPTGVVDGIVETVMAHDPETTRPSRTRLAALGPDTTNG